MPAQYTIPVFARRLYGTRYRLMPTGLSSDPFGRHGQQGRFGRRHPIGELVRTIDYRHGTGHGVDEIGAMFAADADFPNQDGRTVADLWADTGIGFELLAVEDAAIDSDLADFMPSGSRSTRALLDRLDRPDVVNLYFVRDIHGARGFAGLYRPHLPGSSGRIVMADNFDLDSWVGGGEAGIRFRRWRNIITLAHEFGHVLGLPHVPRSGNVMDGDGTSGASTGIDVAQGSVARHRARFLSGAETPMPVGPTTGTPPTP